MSAPIGPGDYIECIRVGESGGGAFVLGGIYVVEAVGLYKRQPWVNCVGMPTPKDYGFEWAPGWNADAFRPIYRPSADLIEQLKQPAPDAVRELEDA